MEEQSKAENIKSNITRKNVKIALSSLISQISAISKLPENGLIFFFGQVNDEFIQEIIEPPEPIKTDYYKCDSEFFLVPLEEMVAPKTTYGILTMDLSGASLGYLRGSDIIPIISIESRVENKHHHGGQSAQRFERLRDVSINEYYKKVAKAFSDSFQDVSGIIIGGPAMTKDDFLKGSYLEDKLKRKILGVVNTSYIDESGLKEVADASEELISESEYMQEKKLIDKFFELLYKNPERCIYGNKVDDEIETGRINTLLLSDKFYKYEEMEKICSRAEKHGTKVQVISSTSELGKIFATTFSAAAILRY